MHKKFEINRTKKKGSCQLGRKVVPRDSKSDLPLDLLKNAACLRDFCAQNLFPGHTCISSNLSSILNNPANRTNVNFLNSVFLLLNLQGTL